MWVAHIAGYNFIMTSLSALLEWAINISAIFRSICFL
jgi:hypothetical protein